MYGAPEGIRTPDRSVRRQTYEIEHFINQQLATLDCASFEQYLAILSVFESCLRTLSATPIALAIKYK